MAAIGEGFLVKAFPRNMCARVRLVAQCARIGGGVSVSLSEFAIIYLSVYELNKGVPSQGLVVKRRCMARSTFCVVVPTS